MPRSPGSLDLQSLGSASSIGGDDGFDTDRVTLPSLCSHEAPKDLSSSDYFSGANVIVSRDKVSVWQDDRVRCDDGGTEPLPLPLRTSSDFVRRRLHTPPEVRRRIHALQQASRDRSAAQRLKSILLGDDSTGSVPNSAAHSDPRSRDGLKSRARSGAASREVALRIIQERQRVAAEREKEAAMREKAHAAMMHAAGGGGMKHSGAHSSHAYLHSTTEDDKEARRQANEKRKRDKGTVATLRKKPTSPPKTAGDAASHGGLFGDMENEPAVHGAEDQEGEGEGEDVGDDLSVDASVLDVDPILQVDDDNSVVSVGSSHSLLTAQSAGTSESRRQHNKVAAGTQEALRLLQQANDAILEEQHTAYFGSQAKAAMRLKFLNSSRNLQKYPKDDDVPEELRSPRSMYLRESQKRSLVPLSLTVRKRMQPRGVFLGGRGLGDSRIMPVVSVIDSLPAIEAIDLSDNRMTDVSLCPLTVKLRTLRTLTHLDLSFNKVGKN